MSGKAWPQRIDDMLERIDEVERIVAPLSSHEFLEDAVILTAVERHIEIIGEITRHIPDDIKKANPDIPWDEIMGMRNILAHGYDVILPDMVWHTATVSLKHLKLAMLRIKDGNR